MMDDARYGDARYYTVNDRPVMVARTPEGGSDCLVFDFANGELVADRAYWQPSTPGSGKDVEVLITLPSPGSPRRSPGCR